MQRKDQNLNPFPEKDITGLVYLPQPTFPHIRQIQRSSVDSQVEQRCSLGLDTSDN